MSLLPANFSGSVRLFPLPDLVLFPHVVQPLRIFEPRYCALLKDALAGDQLITMALLRQQVVSESDPTEPQPLEQPAAGDAKIHPTVCIGRIISQSRNSDGTYYVLLAGIARARVLSETENAFPFRTATVEVMTDQVGKEFSASAQASLQMQLLDAFRQLRPVSEEESSSLQRILNEEVPLGMLTDVVAFALTLPLGMKQALLETTCVKTRARRLLTHLVDARPGTLPPGVFPPQFSDN